MVIYFQDIGEYISVIARAAAIYTDAFIMLSGLLMSYAIIGRLKNNQSPRIGQEYFSRFLRIVPTLGALILFCTFILPELGQGPQWNLVVTHHADICKQNWWRNFLFIHNYFGFSEMVWTMNLFSIHFILFILKFSHFNEYYTKNVGWSLQFSVLHTPIIWESIRNCFYSRRF